MTFWEFREYLSEVAWFWPGIVGSILLSLVLSSPVARWTASRRAIGAALVFSVGLVVSATLTPSLEAVRRGAIGGGSCDLDRIGPASLAEMVAFGDPTFNILLFVPLGVACGLLPSSPRSLALLLGALVLPLAIEMVQLVATSLDRACQTSDVSDNLSGLLIGFAIGLLARAIGDLRGRGTGRPGGAPEGPDATPSPSPSDAVGPPRP